jgi:general secretion pathway protein M
MNAAPSPSQDSAVQASGAAVWWRSLAPRERRLVTLAALLVGAALLWAVAVQPAWRTLRAAPAQLAQLEQQHARMQGWATETASLRATPAIAPPQALAALQAAAERLGERARVVPGPDRVTVSLTGVSPGVLGPWLEEVRRTARARPLEANLTRGPDGFSGTLVLGLGSGGGSP